MLRRSGELFRWAREQRRQSERFSEASFFHRLSERWRAVARRAPVVLPPPAVPAAAVRNNRLPRFWQKSNPAPKARPASPGSRRG